MLEVLLVSAASGTVGGVAVGHMARLERDAWRHRRLIAIVLRLRALGRGEPVVVVGR